MFATTTIWQKIGAMVENGRHFVTFPILAVAIFGLVTILVGLFTWWATHHEGSVHTNAVTIEMLEQNNRAQERERDLILANQAELRTNLGIVGNQSQLNARKLDQILMDLKSISSRISSQQPAKTQ